jgi:hypothetical protein
MVKLEQVPTYCGATTITVGKVGLAGGCTAMDFVTALGFKAQKDAVPVQAAANTLGNKVTMSPAERYLTAVDKLAPPKEVLTALLLIHIQVVPMALTKLNSALHGQLVVVVMVLPRDMSVAESKVNITDWPLLVKTPDSRTGAGTL